MGFGLVGLHVKGVLPRKLFAVSRNQLTLEGAVPSSVSKVPNCQLTIIKDLLNRERNRQVDKIVWGTRISFCPILLGPRGPLLKRGASEPYITGLEPQFYLLNSAPWAP